MNTLAHINTLHELLELALSDLEKAEKDPAVEINMSVWHEPNCLEGVCEVCLGGAVIHGTLGASVLEDWSPSQFALDTRLRLQALDYLREGYVECAWLDLHDTGDELDQAPLSVQELSRDISAYDEDHAQWWSDMRQLLADLKEAGI